MREYIPMLREGEIDAIKDEIKGQKIVVVFLTAPQLWVKYLVSFFDGWNMTRS